jgi:DNA-binding Lrp family transcriptional regulator
MDPILELLETNARLTPEEIGKMLDRTPADVRRTIEKFEKEGIIVGYRTIINKESVHDEKRAVSALIEVKVTPESEAGFDRVAEHLAQYPEVSSVYLLSGTYDLLLVIDGKDLHSVARFVAEKLSSLEPVKGTVTHFHLKTYKEYGVTMKKREDQRIPISF